jgi:ABC-type branched-subunit amino acid transport system substrate-binding protein
VGVRNALVNAGTAFEGVSWTQSEGRSLPASLTSRLTRNGVNRIIVASEKESFVSDLVRNLGILLGRGYKIVLYAPSRIRTFETIDSSTYHQCYLHICSPYFADYDADNVKAFIRSYRALYHTEPSQFAFQGYDLARYFAGLVAKYGNRWTRALSRVPGSGIHTDFQFESAHTGSYRNTAIRRIVYNTDYSTELVR